MSSPLPASRRWTFFLVLGIIASFITYSLAPSILYHYRVTEQLPNSDQLLDLYDQEIAILEKEEADSLRWVNNIHQKLGLHAHCRVLSDAPLVVEYKGVTFLDRQRLLQALQDVHPYLKHLKIYSTATPSTFYLASSDLEPASELRKLEIQQVVQPTSAEQQALACDWIEQLFLLLSPRPNQRVDQPSPLSASALHNLVVTAVNHHQPLYLLGPDPLIKQLIWNPSSPFILTLLLDNDAPASEAYSLTYLIKQLGLGDTQLSLDQHLITLSLQEYSQPYMVIDLSSFLLKQEARLMHLLQQWRPTTLSLQASELNFMNGRTYADPATTAIDKRFSLVIDYESHGGGIPTISLYGIETIRNQLREEKAQREIDNDLQMLETLLKTQGFLRISQTLDDPVIKFIAAPRLTFPTLPSSKRFRAQAVAPLLSVKSWVASMNQREDQRHQALLDSYYQSEKSLASLNPQRRAAAILPPVSLIGENLSLYWRKLLRGNERQILRWGADLSNKSILKVELLDKAGKVIYNPLLIEEARNQLMQSINQLGITEPIVQSEGSQLLVTLPSPTSSKVKELLNPPQLRLHLVNERFSSQESPFYEDTQRFIAEVVKEAEATGTASVERVQEIATFALNTAQEGSLGRKLYDAGLRLAPNDSVSDGELDTTFSLLLPVRSV